MSERRRLVTQHFQRLDEIAPLGYGLGAHIRFATPLFTHSTLPQAWQDIYAANNYAMRDPMIFWGIGKAGTIRWSEITLPDPFGVIKKAAEYGLKYGATVACGKITSRTLIALARADREFDDKEIAEAERIGKALHEITEPPKGLTPAMIEVLRLIGAGTRPAAAAAQLGITEAAFEARLNGALEELGADTTAEGLRLAREYKLI